MVVDPKKKKVGPLLFGWCLRDSHDHGQCRTSFTNVYGVEYVCQCPCHKKKSRRSSAP